MRGATCPWFSATLVGGKFCLRSAVPLVSDDAPIQWTHLAYEGAWKGHHQGEFELTRERFDQAIRNLNAQKNPIPLDFDHEREFMPPPWPARGWVHDLKVEEGDDGKAHLWGLIEFGPKAVQFNREGGYRFCSVVMDFEAIDRVTGEPIGLRLTSVGLTDEPFIDGQNPIHLSHRGGPVPVSKRKAHAMSNVSKEALKAALDGLEGDEISAEQLMAAMEYAAAQEGKSEHKDEPEAPMADGPPGDEEDEAPMSAELPDEVPAADEPEEAVPAGDMPEDEVAAADDAAMVLAPLMEATGLDMAGLMAAIQENLDAVVQALQGALESPAASAPLSDDKSNALALSARDETIRALSSRLEEATAYRAKREREDAESDVDTLIQEGRILADAREDWISVRLSSRDRFDKMAAGLRCVVPVGSHALSATPPAKPDPKEDPVVEIDEEDPEVKALRRSLSAAKVPAAKQDKTIRRRIAARG